MICFRIFILFFIFVLHFPATKSSLYSNKFLMKAEVATNEAKIIAEKYGFIFHKQVIPGYFVLKRNDVKDKTTSRSTWKSDTMKKDYPQIKSIKQERYLEMAAHSVENELSTSAEFSVTDPYWNNMWHLHPDREPNMGVHKAWSMGYTGKGVTLAFIDSGIDPSQTDLQRNYVPELAYDYLDDDDNPLINDTADASHGTNCAGIVVAEKNNSQCIVGIAHDANFTNLRTLGETKSATFSGVALALLHHMEDIDVYSNSWGIPDIGIGFPKSQSLINDALRVGVYSGRRGKGVIYTFSSGNGGTFQDCNLDIYVSNIYTIAVNSVAYDGSPADYAETCTAVMISAFGGSLESGAQITTTDSNNACTTSFRGTSAACPMVTGIIALTLQANPELTWRDIQHLIVETATTSDLKNGSFVTNGSGRNVSLFFGFGLISADTMISRAVSWKTVPSLHRYTSATKLVNSASYIYNIQSSMLIRSNITHIEQVLVWIKFRTSNYKSVSFNLTSPSGTENRILRRQVYNSDKNTSWTALTVHCWGENPNGEWTLNMSSTGTAYLYEWRLYIYGTLIDPLLDNAKDVSSGYVGSQCSGTSCWQPHSVCNNKTAICVCEDGYSDKTGSCIKEGDVGAECERTHHCAQEKSVCSNTTGRCECESGYRALTGKCIKDGDYGGRCLLNGTCTGEDIVCNTYVETCVKCPSNSHKIENQCMKDGSVGGKCLSDGSCSGDNAFCEKGNNTCISCPRYYFTVIDGKCLRDGVAGGKCLSNSSCIYDDAFCDSSNNMCVYCPRYSSSVIDGKCVRDGSLGGYCHWLYACNTPETYCNRSSNKCECRRGYNETTAFCNTDGLVGGKCLSNSSCIDDDAFCDSSNNMCVYCPRYSSSVIDGKCVRDGSLGGHCRRWTSKCSSPETYCNSSSNKCECRTGYNETTGFCNMDGFVGGNCLSNGSCFGDVTFCNSSSNTCVSCPTYFSTVKDGKCVEDGSLGGFCNYYSVCYTRGTYCFSNKCECRSGYNESTGSCSMDGFVGGNCLSNSSCFSDNTFCDKGNNTCISCPTYSSTVVDGKCVEDGTLGGVCDRYYPLCTPLFSRCNRSRKKCECLSGYNEVNGSCKASDGYIGGRCTLNGTCFGYNTACDRSYNTCVRCRYGHSAINGKCVKDGTLGGVCKRYYASCTPLFSRCNRLRKKCECVSGYIEVNGSCIGRDGYVGGRCTLNSTCFGSNSACDRSNNICVRCRYGHSKINDTCVKDGTLGGVCKRYYASCTPLFSRCNRLRKKCECVSGYIEVNGSCIVRDGYVGGRCTLNSTCFGYNSACDRSNNMCVRCPYGHSKINDTCVKDRSLGGYCRYSCFSRNVVCNRDKSMCECKRGYKASGRKCIRSNDGRLGGQCLSDGTCIPHKSICNTNNNTCVRCPLHHHWIHDQCLRVELNQTGTEDNTTCDGKTNNCVKNTNSYGEAHKTLVDLGYSELQAIFITAVTIILAVAVILCYKRFHKQTELQQNRPVHV